MTSTYRISILALSLALACGDDGKTSASDGSTGPATGDTTQGSSTTTDATTGTTSDATSTTGEPTTTGTGTGGATGTTGVDVAAFERFRISRAAGPCPPESDCDGFIELLAPGMLRIETFGNVGNPVDEFMITPFEYQVAVQVFADPELLALLDGPDPLCDPPTDIFESMVVQVADVGHDATTTACQQPPLVAARDMAQMLSDTYLPP